MTQNVRIMSVDDIFPLDSKGEGERVKARVSILAKMTFSSLTHLTSARRTCFQVGVSSQSPPSGEQAPASLIGKHVISGSGGDNPAVDSTRNLETSHTPFRRATTGPQT